MEWIAVKIRINHDDRQLAMDLIADVFFSLGVKGVEVEDPRMSPEEGWGDDAVPLPEHDAVIGYFPDTPPTKAKLGQLEKRIRELEKKHGITCVQTFKRVDEEDWAVSWKAYFWPQRITPRITVKPTWRTYQATADEIVLEIDPGMAFGTGTHPTTALCIQLMEKYLKKNERFLDVGTGSGILMTAAAKLGAGCLLGIDNDDIALVTAGENLRLNQISEKQFELTRGHLADGIEGYFDLIVANILSEAICRLLDTIGQHMAEGAVLICSGICEDHLDLVLKKMKQEDLFVLEAPQREGWVAIACTNDDTWTGR